MSEGVWAVGCLNAVQMTGMILGLPIRKACRSD